MRDLDEKMRDYVVHGLECCILRDPDDKVRCSQCPLYEATNCLNRLKNSALILLKPRLLTLEAVKRLKYGDVVYIEGIIGECFAAIVHDNVQHLGVLQTVSLPSDGVGNSDYDYYQRTWRCWNSEPTKEQREAVPWEK